VSRENEQLQGGETRYLHNLIIVLLAIYISEATDEYSAAMTRLDLMQGPTTSPTFSAIETSLLLTPLSLDHLLDSHWVETSVLAIVIPIASSTNQKREKGTFEGYGAVAIAIFHLWYCPSPNGSQNTTPFFEILIAQ